MILLTCPQCKKQFQPVSGHAHRRYCTQRCRKRFTGHLDKEKRRVYLREWMRAKRKRDKAIEIELKLERRAELATKIKRLLDEHP